jgi:hypothetical protein
LRLGAVIEERCATKLRGRGFKKGTNLPVSSNNKRDYVHGLKKWDDLRPLMKVWRDGEGEGQVEF